MLNKKIEIKLNGVAIPLWFNNYASAELQKMYGADITTVMNVLLEKLKDNYLIILSDLIKIGIKGNYLAKDTSKPEYLESVNEWVAEEPDETLMLIWLEVWTIFSEHMGLNLPQEENPRKKKVNTRKAKV